MIYDYLFYKGYQLGKRSGNFKEMPIMAGVMWVGLCLMFNVFAMMMLVQVFFANQDYIIAKKYKYIFSITLFILVIFYFLYKERYKVIIDRFERKERQSGKGLNPLPVIFAYYIISFLILLLAGMIKNRDGFFNF